MPAKPDPVEPSPGTRPAPPTTPGPGEPADRQPVVSSSAQLPPNRDPLADLAQHPLFRWPGSTPFRPDAPPASAAANGDAADERIALRQHVAELSAQLAAAEQALRVAHSDLRKIQQQNADLQRQLDATEASKRQLLRQLDQVRGKRSGSPQRPNVTNPSPSPAGLATSSAPSGSGPRSMTVPLPLTTSPDQPLVPPALNPSPPPTWERWEALFTGELPTSKATLNDVPLELKAFLATVKAQLRARTGVTLTERDQVIIALAAYRILVQSGPDLAAELVKLQPHHPDAVTRSRVLGARLLDWLERELQRRETSP